MGIQDMLLHGEYKGGLINCTLTLMAYLTAFFSRVVSGTIPASPITLETECTVLSA